MYSLTLDLQRANDLEIRQKDIRQRFHYCTPDPVKHYLMRLL